MLKYTHKLEKGCGGGCGGSKPRPIKNPKPRPGTNPRPIKGW